MCTSNLGCLRNETLKNSTAIESCNNKQYQVELSTKNDLKKDV